MPGNIGDGADPEILEPEAVSDEADVIAAFMAEVAFEEQDVRDMLVEFFNWLAERFDNDNWKLTERQERMLGKPAAQLANSLWLKLQQYMPEAIARWCASTPGAFAFLTAAGLVVTPKVMNQIKLSRQRRQGARGVRPPQPGRPQQAPQAPHVYDGPVGSAPAGPQAVR